MPDVAFKNNSMNGYGCHINRSQTYASACKCAEDRNDAHYTTIKYSFVVSSIRFVNLPNTKLRHLLHLRFNSCCSCTSEPALLPGSALSADILPALRADSADDATSSGTASVCRLLRQRAELRGRQVAT